ncbi:MAG: hypothetical protein ACJAXN_002165 [Psychromonas sp.]|jgi:hypothetical protein
MKFFTLIFTLLLSTQVFAHQDHALGEGSLHLLYHAIFWGLCAVVTVKAVGYFKNKKKQKIEK